MSTQALSAVIHVQHSLLRSSIGLTKWAGMERIKDCFKELTD